MPAGSPTRRTSGKVPNSAGRDRLTGLRTGSGLKEKSPRDGSYGSVAGPESTGKIIKILSDIDRDAKLYLADIATISHNINVLSQDMRQAIGQQAEDKIVADVAKLVDQAKGYNAKVKACIDDLEKVGSSRAQSLTKHERTYCQSILTHTSAAFQEHVKKLLAAQSGFELEHKAKMKVQVHVLYPEALRKEVAELVDGDPGAMQLMLQRKFENTVSDNDANQRGLQESVRTLRGQHDSLLKLQEDVLELNELFFYLSALVDRQHEQLLTIEANVDATDEYVGQGIVKLEKAEVHQESYEYKRSWIMGGISALTIVGVILLVVLFVWCCGVPGKDTCTGASCGGKSAAPPPAAAPPAAAPPAAAPTAAAPTSSARPASQGSVKSQSKELSTSASSFFSTWRSGRSGRS
ncbi:unnamed protein product [Amoebophrya sp. A25]|nr:unnamed protein product [Amoebophrya sp. A25]|eukprot:GSA25T00025373001.1